MALTAFTKFRFLWGAVDWQSGTDHPYAAAQTGSLGTSALGGAGNVGVRRVLVKYDRTTVEAGMDPAEVHFDFLNLTAGSPDDTWTSGDYTTLETALDTFFTAIAPYVPSSHKVSQYDWYRVGVGVVPPNPAERSTVKGTPIAGSGSLANPLQVASSLTFRTSVRRSWGRTYLPVGGISVNSNGRIGSTQVNALCTAGQTLANSAASSDFYLGVTSKKLNAFLVAEKIEVDDVLDIVRRRRPKAAIYKKILP